jgi:hypothetical protein
MWKAITGVIVGVVMGCVMSAPVMASKKIKQRRPDGETYIIFNNAFAAEGYVACPDCGATVYIFMQLTRQEDNFVGAVTYWHDLNKTQRNRDRLGVRLMAVDPFGDPMFEK